jgi:hypothetical protein
MPRFFHRIRKSFFLLVPANDTGQKLSRYLLYAIGEIILVVIGILIALQINNWNEDRKSLRAEKEILTNLYDNLGVDSIQFDYYKVQFQEVDNLHKDLYRYGVKNEDLDTIAEPMLVRRSLYFKQLINLDSKENIYSLKNQKIKNALVSYLGSINDMEVAYHLELKPLLNERLKPYISEQAVYKTENWFEISNKMVGNMTFEETTGKNLIDKDILLALSKSKKFQQLLFEVNFKWTEFYSRLETVMIGNSNLRKLIKSELKYY